MERGIRGFRIVFASLLGAAVSTLALWLPITFGVTYLLLMAGTALIMCDVASGGNKQDLVMTAIWYLMLSLLFTWLLELVTRYGSHRIGIGAVIVAVLLIGGILIYMKHHKRKQTGAVYKTEIHEKGQCITVTALFDTGNSLKEPISRRPVSIVEQGLVEGIWKEKEAEGRRVIPYHSIGTKHGILQGMEVEELVIWKEDRRIVWKQAMIAVYEGSLSGDGSFQMILHPELEV